MVVPIEVCYRGTIITFTLDKHLTVTNLNLDIICLGVIISLEGMLLSEYRLIASNN